MIPSLIGLADSTRELLECLIISKGLRFAAMIICQNEGIAKWLCHRLRERRSADPKAREDADSRQARRASRAARLALRLSFARR